MVSRAVRELAACVERVHSADDVRLTLADGMHDHLAEAWAEWDGEATEASRILGIFFFYRYLAAHEPTDLRSAVMALTPCLLYSDMALPPDMLSFLAEFGVCEAELLRQDARDSPDPVQAGRAAFAWRRIVMATDDDHPQRVDRMTAMVRAVRLLAARQGDTREVDQVVAVARKRLVPRGRRKRRVTLHELFLALEHRYEATGDTADHEAALECAEELAALSPGRDPDGSYFAFVYGEKLFQRFLRDPSTPDPGRAIGLLRESAALPDPGRPTRLLLLSRALSYAAAKDPGFLPEAVAAARQAEALVQRNHKDHPTLQWHLAVLYFQRYEREGAAEDLDRAEAAVIEAGMCLPRLLPLTALAADIEFARYRRTGDSERLHRALVRRERVVRRLPADDAHSRAEALHALSQAQTHWYRRTGSTEDLDRAIANGRAAVDLLTATDPRRSRFLAGLGGVWFTRFTCRREPGAVPEAVRLFRAAAASAPDRHHPHAMLATALWQAYELTGDSTLLDESVAAGERALELAPPGARADGLLDLGAALRLRFGRSHDAGDLHRAKAAIAEAVALPGLSSRTQLQIRLEQAELAELSPAGAAERLQALEAAVALLPDLGERSRYYEDNEFMLQVHSGLGAKAADAAVRAHRPDRALELLERARGILADTVRGAPRSTAGDLCGNTGRGPVVTVSTVETGGLALLVTPSGVHPVSLPGLTLGEARARLDVLHDALASRACEDLVGVLGWLWHTVGRPVLDALTATGWNGSRLWWCPAGIMALFPLHAAGDGEDSVMAGTMSSYLPTVRAMPAARRAPAPPGEALAVAMSRTPGQAFLAGAVSEANSLTRLLGATVLHNEQATRSAVLAALHRARIVHFACHAEPDTRVPTLSRLLLHDRPLTPRDLPGRLDADLAYLSACATSDVVFTGADEAMHMTAAFHLAGFRHVIGTLWPVDDGVASDIAEHFYALIAAHGPDDAARALHSATTEIRRAHPDRPDLWASHLHVGP
ncbi:CHAT domain-containing protein [Streptomyces sp. H51]|uniref:CHAT domain-containing protein n=1 Tax=Streptomyces sp. H51 TaxID=3111770 RepID=UPI002D78B374|nr:CHAT domain-containing protein [Streptomyces sp. H51]